jgi:hypothetical protein
MKDKYGATIPDTYIEDLERINQELEATVKALREAIKEHKDGFAHDDWKEEDKQLWAALEKGDE